MGDKIRKQLSLIGNPAPKADWWTSPKGDKPLISLVRQG
jgi:hypothetical protein